MDSVCALIQGRRETHGETGGQKDGRTQASQQGRRRSRRLRPLLGCSTVLYLRLHTLLKGLSGGALHTFSTAAPEQWLSEGLQDDKFTCSLPSAADVTRHCEGGMAIRTNSKLKYINNNWKKKERNLNLCGSSRLIKKDKKTWFYHARLCTLNSLTAVISTPHAS